MAADRDRELRELLTADRAATTERMTSLRRDLEAIVEAARLVATDDEHDPEGATIAFERSQTAALLESSHQHLMALDDALARLSAGAYGRCERCGEPIATGRLQARPTTHTCIDCAT
ncbi:transcriptional regulator, TraR/DksA family [Kribbella flavida DSM 17836]|uniref:Transcriptional regulator, TraR/DksA family n=1 Tax=Kribbella flavida (strain DSM 17836 / JCM 10339 / NBRC 14399) TaxID=479435 RepID=D2Q3T9_KRIFD|nr:TraR/DksA C4-type zinc finger protein [Kribbella flavida]ADB35961.1 transcriptional regulator, TraR/DksA family [Kribbella flavida DSM 17836]